MRSHRLILLFILLWAGKGGMAQPGSYTFCFGFVLYDSGSVVKDTSEFKVRWQEGNKREGWPCGSTIYTNRFVFTNRLPHDCDGCFLTIINKNDTMRLTLLERWQMDEDYFIKNLPFQKGRFVLTPVDFEGSSQLPENFRWQEEKRDKAGNLVVEHYWGLEKKLLRQRVVYDNNFAVRKRESWWANGNREAEDDHDKRTSRRWYGNGQLLSVETANYAIYYTEAGKVIKRINRKTIEKKDSKQ